MLECVLFKDGRPDVAYWGYENTSGTEVTIPAGSEREPLRSRRGRPQATERVRGGKLHRRLPDTVRGGERTARVAARRAQGRPPPRSRRACNPTVELRKVDDPRRRPGRLPAPDQRRRRRDGRERGDKWRPADRHRRGDRHRDGGAGHEPGRLRLEGRVHTERTVAVSVPGTKVDGEVAGGRHRRLHVHEHAEGLAADPASATAASATASTATTATAATTATTAASATTSASGTSAAGAADAARPRRRCSTSSSTRASSPTTVLSRRPAHVDDDGDEPLRGRGGGRERHQARRSTLVPHAADLPDTVAGHMQAVHLQPRSCGSGRLGDGHCGDRGNGGRRSSSNIVRVSSEEVESNYRNNVAAAVARVIGPLTPPVALRVCRTLTAEPRALQSGRSSVVRVTARNRVGKPLGGISVRVIGTGVNLRAITNAAGDRAVHGRPAKRSASCIFVGGRPIDREPAFAVPHAARRPRGEPDAGHGLGNDVDRRCRATRAAGGGSRQRSGPVRIRARPPARAARAGSCRGCRRRCSANR